ncbi:MAG: T9SS type A sorting domain-containing protein [Ignavibacteriaceae bacterium]|nr:T9SS type A sorting domain-containing protein [Ignavibacteriaceae bacterium]
MKIFFVLLLFFSLDLFAQKPAGTLPVELVYFNGYFTDGKVVLFWGTATEVNNYGFEVERSMPQTPWTNVGFVLGSGNSNSPKSYFFEDSTDLQTSIYFYRLKQIDNDGQSKYSDTDTISVITKLENEVNSLSLFSLEQNFPNPFNPATVISWRLAVGSLVTLRVFDVLGKEVATLVNEEQDAGVHNYELVIRNYDLPSGVYFYQLRSGKFVETKKFVFLK